MNASALPSILTVIYRMTDGSHTSLHEHFDGESWDEKVMAARDVVRRQETKYPGCVIAAELRDWQPHGGAPGVAAKAGLCKVYQPSEWRVS